MLNKVQSQIHYIFIYYSKIIIEKKVEYIIVLHFLESNLKGFFLV